MHSDVDQKLAELKGWQLSTETDRMDKTPVVSLMKLAETGPGGVLMIRCARGKTELFVTTDEIVDRGGVRIKLDDAKPQRQAWSESESHGGLFAPDPIGLARQLATAESFLFEYKPFRQSPTTIEFKVAGLGEKLGTIAEACRWSQIDQAKAAAKAAAKAKAERARRQDAMLREVLSKHVEPCREQWPRFKDTPWCFYDEANSVLRHGSAPKESREAALDYAVQLAKSGTVFIREMADINRELK
jgi:type VI secretion system (T6SS) VasI/EvfG family protein